MFYNPGGLTNILLHVSKLYSVDFWEQFKSNVHKARPGTVRFLLHLITTQDYRKAIVHQHLPSIYSGLSEVPWLGLEVFRKGRILLRDHL